MLKVGDRVRVAFAGSMCRWYQVGATGKLTSFDGRDWLVDFTDSEPGTFMPCDDNSWYANADRLELIDAN